MHKKFKTSGTHKYINICSFEKYRVDDYKKIFTQLVFKNNAIFDNLNTANSHFYQKIMTVTDKIVHSKTKRVKENTKKWFNVEV